MKIYQHTGGGHYIGSNFTVIENSSYDAAIHISRLLLECGLGNEKLNIEEIEIEAGTIVVQDDGDY